MAYYRGRFNIVCVILCILYVRSTTCIDVVELVKAAGLGVATSVVVVAGYMHADKRGWIPKGIDFLDPQLTGTIVNAMGLCVASHLGVQCSREAMYGFLGAVVVTHLGLYHPVPQQVLSGGYYYALRKRHIGNTYLYMK